MPKNLNSFILPDNIIETMKKRLIKTGKIHRELGFNLCKVEDSNELRDDTHCIGSACEIALAKACKIGKKVGSFHTHPKNGKGRADPSIGDLQNAYYFGINCIGGEEDNNVKCYVRKDKELNKKDYNAITHYREKYRPLNRPHYISTEKGREIILAKFREREYIRDKLKESYFDTIDII